MLYIQHQITLPAALFFALFAVGASLTARADAPQTPSAAQFTAWTPDAVIVAKLAPSADAGSGFQIQPPVDYVAQTITAPNGGGTLKAWVGPARADGSHGTVLVTTLTPPPADAATYTPALVLDKMLEGIARRRKNGKRTPTETGTVAGQAFVRARWEGTDTTTGFLMRGFAYVTQSGATFIQVSSQDIAPHDKDALPLAEASALTFKKPLSPSTLAPPAKQ